MGDADATQERRDVVADVDEIIEHVINANMLNMPYYVYSELFDAVDGLGAEIENLQSENAKLRELVRTFYHCTTSGECDECPISGGGPVHLMPDTICDTIHDRMRELVVEP